MKKSASGTGGAERRARLKYTDAEACVGGPCLRHGDECVKENSPSMKSVMCGTATECTRAINAHALLFCDLCASHANLKTHFRHGGIQ
jgi:hypothetical protein